MLYGKNGGIGSSSNLGTNYLVRDKVLFSQQLKASYSNSLPFDTLDSINMLLHNSITPRHYKFFLISIKIMNYLPV
jgi:hypothetical protein